MSPIPWILIAAGVALIILAIILFVLVKVRKKEPADYYLIFIMGLLWTVIGIPLKNITLYILGLLCMIIGLLFRKRWKMNQSNWRTLSRKEQRPLIILALVILVLTLGGIITYLLVE
jgi:hypothetical protein